MNNMACAAGLGAITGTLTRDYYQLAINALDQADLVLAPFVAATRARLKQSIICCYMCTLYKLHLCKVHSYKRSNI